MSRRLAGALAALILLVGTSASANGRFPASNAVLFAPDDEATVIVRVTFGLLVSRDDARSWSWICERAIGFSGLEDPSYVVTKSGTMVAGLFEGLRVSRDRGCTWEPVATDARVFVDLTTRSDGAIVALSSSYERHSDAGSLYRSQLFVSTDDARSFVPLGVMLDETLLAESVEVAPSNPQRLYVSAVRGADSKRQGVLLVSNDGGVHWIERALDLAPKELAPFIAAVDGARPDRVFVRTSASPDGPTRLLVSEDAAKTFSKLMNGKGPLLGFALGEDGATLQVGGPDDGLFSGRIAATTLTHAASVKLQCLSRRRDVLWACSNEANGFVVGTASSADGPFTPRLHLRDIGGPLSCPAASSVAKECGGDWQKLRSDLGIGEIVSVDAGVSRATPTAESRDDDRLTKRPLTWLVAILAVLLGGSLVARSRRR